MNEQRLSDNMNRVNSNVNYADQVHIMDWQDSPYVRHVKRENFNRSLFLPFRFMSLYMCAHILHICMYMCVQYDGRTSCDNCTLGQYSGTEVNFPLSIFSITQCV